MAAILVLFSIVSFLIGFFVACRPKAAIEIQRKFYAGINWRIEPISMEKEVCNTRVMGLFLIAFSIAAPILMLAGKTRLH